MNSISSGYPCEYEFLYNGSLNVHWIMLLNINSLVSQTHRGSDPAHEYSHTQLIFLQVITSIKMEILLVLNNEKCIWIPVPGQFHKTLVFFLFFLVNDKLKNINTYAVHLCC